MSQSPFVITISRQLGSGAAYIGQQLAARLGLLYLDRVILQTAAQQLNILEDLLQEHDEVATSFWQSVIQSFSYGSPEMLYVPPTITSVPTDHELFAVESRIISQVAQTQSAVIVGRGGVHVLHEHPRHLSIFFYAESTFRQQRVEKLYHVSASEARSAIETCDNARARYHRMITGKEWNDARQYHLCLDTSTFGIPATIETILFYIRERFGVGAIEQASHLSQ
ncbi:MAG TPA: cytidylate kinase-like family protein [Armatimonadota bacterium]|nr:cytidylate kinase-like family protein [Armatimonadota bacterium]